MSFPVQKKLPAKNNKYYNTTGVGGYSHCIVGKPTQSGLNVLDNCVGWACGRFNEIYSYFTGYKGMKYYQLNCNAEDFIKRGKNIGLKSRTEPICGGIMVWEGKGKKAGHVAFVEHRNTKTSVLTSESGYNSFAFMNKTRTKGNGNWGANSDYKYLGCLINPPLTKDSVDLVADLQTNMDKQWNCKLTVDGSFGPSTTKACNAHHLYLGINAKTMVKWLQNRLIELGYSCGKEGADGSYGYSTQNAVKKYQTDKKLKIDGRVGVQTYKSLTE